MKGNGASRFGVRASSTGGVTAGVSFALPLGRSWRARVRIEVGVSARGLPILRPSVSLVPSREVQHG